MTTTLILYSSVDGQTKKICHYIADEIKKYTPDVVINLIAFDDFAASPNFVNVDTLVIGASIRYGKHRPAVAEFIEAHKGQLNKINSAFFSVNLVARKDEKNTAQTNPYVIKFFELTDWQPTLVDVFAGQIDYARYRFFDKIMIKFIMWMTKGPTSSPVPIEFTNWLRVRAFAKKICQF